MKMVLNNFWKEEDGGADQLIIGAILVVVGIGVALLFGNEIKEMVVNLFAKTSDSVEAIKVENYSGD